MKTTINGVILKAISVVVPKKRRSKEDLAKLVGEKYADRICRNTGIDFVRVSEEGETAADLCEVAARIILKETDVSKIVGLVFVSQTPDYIMPATSCLLQYKLGLSPETVCYDVNSGCTGFVKGLHLASMIASTAKGDVLLLTGDTMTKYVSPKDHSLFLVIGDAGSAALITHKPDTDMNIYFNMKTFGEDHKALIIPAGGNRTRSSDATRLFLENENGNLRSQEHLYMDGMGIMSFAISKVVKHVRQDISLLPFKPEIYLFHQANKYIVDTLAKNLNINSINAPVAVSDYGNTGQCTIPLTLCQCFYSKKKMPGKVLMIAFGVGLTVATAALDLSSIKIYSIKEI